MSETLPFTFTVNEHGNVVRMSNKGAATITIYRAATKAKGEAFLAAYLALPIELRRKLREAVA